MGYFSNGSEGMDYRDRYCDQCKHGDDCPVWSLHFDYNYDAVKDEGLRAILDSFIPRAKDGCWNEECRMFIPVGPKSV